MSNENQTTEATHTQTTVEQTRPATPGEAFTGAMVNNPASVGVGAAVQPGAVGIPAAQQANVPTQQTTTIETNSTATEKQ